MESTFKIQSGNSIGTAFILGHPSSTQKDILYFVLVTAKHVLENFKGDTAILHFRKRVGDKFERYSGEIAIREEGKPLWVSHPDADVAVMKLFVPKEAHIRSIPVIQTVLLANDEMLKEFELQPGDELMVLGFPFGAEANKEGFPVLRSGRIASYPLVPSTETRTFLLDFEVFKGNSGGPVCLYDRNRIYGGSVHLGTVNILVGLVSKERALDEKVKSLEEVVIKRHRLALAEVIHASLIREAIERLFPEHPIPEAAKDPNKGTVTLGN
jgi:hypothetical protein